MEFYVVGLNSWRMFGRLLVANSVPLCGQRIQSDFLIIQYRTGQPGFVRLDEISRSKNTAEISYVCPSERGLQKIGGKD